MKVIALLVFFVSCFAQASEGSDCQTVDETKEFIYEVSISDINWLMDIRRFAFEEEAWETIELLDRKLLGAIYGIFIAKLESKMSLVQISKIEKLMDPTAYYPITWDKLNASQVKEKLEKVKNSALTDDGV